MKFPSPFLSLRRFASLMARLISTIFDRLFHTASKLGEDEKQRLSNSPDNDKESVDTLAAKWPNDLGFDVVREETTPINFPVIGYIPSYAAGILYRNGPGARELFDNAGKSKFARHHWFDGFAQLHRFELISGFQDRGITKIKYNSRFAVDSLMQQCAKSGSWAGYTFGQRRDPCMSLFRKVVCLFTPVPAHQIGTTNTMVLVTANPIGYPGKAQPRISGHKVSKPEYLIGRTDEAIMSTFDPETLEPIGVADQSKLHPLLKGIASAAHARSDPVTGDMFQYNLDFGREATYRVFQVSASTGNTKILATIADPAIPPAYMHSLFLTDNFVVLGIWSAHYALAGLRVLWGKNVLDALSPFDKSDKSKRAQWYVVSRHGHGVVSRFESAPGFCFHTINAFEIASSTIPGGKDLICDMIWYDDLKILHKFYYDNIRSSSPTADAYSNYNHSFKRYSLSVPDTRSLQNLSTAALEKRCNLPMIQEAQLLSVIPGGAVGDIPTMNPRNICKPYRYFWNCTSRPGLSSFFDSLAKIDVVTGECVFWQNPAGHSPGEGIFIPNPEGLDEDDGVILSVVLDGFVGTSYLLCLDARTMLEIGRADCLGPLPFMVHGQHLPTVGETPINT